MSLYKNQKLEINVDELNFSCCIYLFIFSCCIYIFNNYENNPLKLILLFICRCITTVETVNCYQLIYIFEQMCHICSNSSLEESFSEVRHEVVHQMNRP